MTNDLSMARPALRSELAVAIRLTVVLLFAAGFVYPACLWGVSRIVFRSEAEGSLVYDTTGTAMGSALIGQAFTKLEYFHGRPSVAAYDASASSGSNLGPSNPKLLTGNGTSYAGVVRYAAAYRRENHLGVDAALPADAVTASGSGIDPHISPENAELQIERVAAERAPLLAEGVVRALVVANTSARTFGILGEPRVNLLRLNLALDSAAGAARRRP